MPVDSTIPNWFDPSVAARMWSDLAVKMQQVVARSAEPSSAFLATPPADATVRAWSRFLQEFAANPARLAVAQADFLEGQFAAWDGIFGAAKGETGTAPEIGKTPKPGDRRFKSEAWQKNPSFNGLMRSYQMGSEWLRNLIGNAENLSPAERKHVSFFAEQFIDAAAPTNFWATNPDVLEKTAKTGGANLFKGFSNLLDDLTADAGHVRRASGDAFELGVNIAATKGSVVLRTDMMELIQFEPTTPGVRQTPFLLIPPWVNKYYLFDLQQKSSFIKWMVDQGFTVFVISWINPDARHADKDFEDYWTEGPQASFDAIRKATGEDGVNLMGYCLGGTLTASGLGYLAAKGDARVRSATLVASLTDFADFGDFEVFVDVAQADAMKDKLKGKGYASSADLTRLFSLLRANDLIWSSAISSYLLADEAVASDLLYWFSDGIGMPAKMLDTFMRRVILDNGLARPGGLAIAETPIDLTRVTTPLCFVSLKDDHVAGWQSTYRGATRFTAPKRFILGGSGHNAGTINPPAARKHGYWTNDAFPSDPEAWLASADRHEGSWWTEWATWLGEYSGPEVAAHTVEGGPLPILEAAPGSYARIRR